MDRIESEVLPADAVTYLNEVEQSNDKTNQFQAEAAKSELHSFVCDFQQKSADWRRASYETKWQKYQRNCDGIFDPDISAKKEDWQSRVFVGITASHRETIHSHLFKTMAGINPPLEIKSRFNLGEVDQSKNIQAIMLREMDKASWSVVFDASMHDADTFGSGFIRVSWKSETAVRKLKKPVKEGFNDNLNPMGMVGYAMRAATGKLKDVAYEEAEEEVIVYRGLSLKHYSIWDIFPDPKALQIPGTTIACRYPITYGEIVKGVADGYYLPEAVDKLANFEETEKYPEGEDVVQSAREVSDNYAPKTDYAKKLDCYEIFGKFPEKWIKTIMGEEVTEGERLISGRVIFHKNCLVAVEINDEYDGEPPIYKLDYYPLNNSFYGRGVPEMLLDSQAVINEIVNQRLDNGAMVLNKSFGVLEKALVNPKQDLVSKPGMMIRLDGNKVPNGDIRNAIMEFKIEDTPLRAGFSEVNEAERWAQERTSANRVTLGTAGLVKDANQTLGGQQILRESAGEKFAYIGMRMEIDFLKKFFHGIWKTIYKNMTPQDIEDSIGPDKLNTFIPITPEEIERDYIYMPLGVFTMENKAMRQARLLEIRQAFMGAPWVNDEAYYDVVMQNADEDPERFKKTEDQIMMDQAQMIQPGMEQGMPPGMPPQGMAVEPPATPMPVQPR
jgi:hypothetical protein